MEVDSNLGIWNEEHDAASWLTIETAHKSTERFLCIDLGEFYCGMELSDIAEILRECQMTPIPCVPKYYLGICNWKGNILAVASLQKLIMAERDRTAAPTVESTMESTQPVVIVLKSNQFECGLLTTQKPQILEFHEGDKLSGDIPDICGELLEVREAYQCEDGRSVYVLDAKTTLEHLVVYQ